ncbi:hypothetical protein IscW_ISCW009281 [Ixodes scapularis]|uniref:Uncharacterized protein n=1 Tax=Ixodes scapularis TaxID=6945 RepID=B7Q0Z7_IXOSC|nr:hypothetical protein IscW_ISCW009281 [Ixodes scapularis]|eukprot:XP_002408666.1 hypothetical protein IscW_ISCW009281 [Ixodes scapularis]
MSGYMHPEGPPPTGLVSVCDRIEEGRRHRRREQIPDVVPRTTDPRLLRATPVSLFIASLSLYRAAIRAVARSLVGNVIQFSDGKSQSVPSIILLSRSAGNSPIRREIRRPLSVLI